MWLLPLQTSFSFGDVRNVGHDVAEGIAGPLTTWKSCLHAYRWGFFWACVNSRKEEFSLWGKSDGAWQCKGPFGRRWEGPINTWGGCKSAFLHMQWDLYVYKYLKYIIDKTQKMIYMCYIDISYIYIYEGTGRWARQQETICRAHGVVQGYLQRVGGERGFLPAG